MTSRMNALVGFSSGRYSLCLFPGIIISSSSIALCASSHDVYSSVALWSGSSDVWISSSSWSSWNNSFCSCSLIFIQSCTIESRLSCQTPRCCFQILLFLVTLLICVITCFLVPFSIFSSLCLLLVLCQLFNQGLCQLHSTSACLGSSCCLHSSSLTFIMRLM